MTGANEYTRLNSIKQGDVTLDEYAQLFRDCVNKFETTPPQSLLIAFYAGDLNKIKNEKWASSYAGMIKSDKPKTVEDLISKVKSYSNGYTCVIVL
jgi:hypothetical protein